MTKNYINIPYNILDPGEIPTTQLVSIWKIDVNDRYKEFKPTGLEHPGVFITYEGNGVFYDINYQKEYYLHENSVFFFEGQDPCRYFCPEHESWKFFFLHFTDLEIIRYLQIPMKTVVDLKDPLLAVQQCHVLTQCFIEKEFGYVLEANLLFQQLLLQLTRKQSPKGELQNSGISKIVHWMHDNISDHLNIGELISMSNMSRTEFFKNFKLMTGMTPGAYFLKLKLQSAQIALQTTDKNIKEIAHALNFTDEFYFSKLFKKEFGVSPSAFKKEVT